MESFVDQMRALLFVTMLTGGIVDAMEAVEKAVAKALDMQQPGDCCATPLDFWDFFYCASSPNGIIFLNIVGITFHSFWSFLPLIACM